jgi:hypothetical protein
MVKLDRLVDPAAVAAVTSCSGSVHTMAIVTLLHDKYCQLWLIGALVCACRSNGGV